MDPMFKTLLSDDGVYRYLLYRHLGGTSGLVALFIMLNPSTANATLDDQTIRKCMEFARAAGAEHMLVVNLFAYRTKSPRALLMAYRRGVDVVGPENTKYVRAAYERADIAIAAWGRNPEGWRWSREHVARLIGDMADLKCLGLTAGRSPKHPLMLPYSARLERYYHPWGVLPERGQSGENPSTVAQ